jgi:EmrB/QacA subfamily drug resistance transporter
MSNGVSPYRPLILASVMASMAMVALEATIVSTAMPQIVAELGGLNLYSWVFSSFLLTQTSMTVVFGKLSDTFGRRPVMLSGIAIFLVGSVLAGFATSMPAMIVFRLIQGVGAGAIQPAGMTIVGDLYPVHERGKIQGYLASVWATSAVAGPLAGGLIIHNFSWAWIFWINVPIGIVAAIGFWFFLKEEAQGKRASIDLAGAALFLVGVASVMIALTEAADGNRVVAWSATAIFCVCAVLFILQEQRAEDPMISFALWRRRPIAIANAVTLLAGILLIGLTTFLPMYVQGVLHKPPLSAGLALTMVMVGWPSGATIASKIYMRFGPRTITIVGAAFLPLGAAVLVNLSPASSPVWAGLASGLMGLGMGLMSVSALMFIQELVERQQRGSATAANIFSRNFGSTLGAAALGAILNFGLSSFTGGRSVSSDELRRIIESDATTIATSDLGLALQQSIHIVFIAMLLIAAVLVLIASFLPAIKSTEPVLAPSME